MLYWSRTVNPKLWPARRWSSTRNDLCVQSLHFCLACPSLNPQISKIFLARFNFYARITVFGQNASLLSFLWVFLLYMSPLLFLPVLLFSLPTSLSIILFRLFILFLHRFVSLSFFLSSYLSLFSIFFLPFSNLVNKPFQRQVLLFTCLYFI
jgi:hypothetical protein